MHDVSFVSRGERVNGFLVEEAGTARRPGIVVVHGSGGDRSELLTAAVTLARRGAVALTITEPSSAHPPPPPTSNSQLLSESRATTQRDVIAVLRAEDVLASLPTVDAERLGYLGWSAGAKTGAFVAASDPRVRALALLSAGADKLSAFVAAAPASLRPQVRRVLGSVDPLRYVARARPGTLLLEDGRQDAVVPHEALENMIEAAPHGNGRQVVRGGSCTDGGGIPRRLRVAAREAPLSTPGTAEKSQSRFGENAEAWQTRTRDARDSPAKEVLR